ncbi:MAG: fused MFS/spermidine synthase [Planctomycetes bacterium]|nr:fused MFS/spermidine synthase [Planctomycetota bacterium]
MSASSTKKVQASMTAMVILFIILGFTFQSNPYRINTIGAPADQYALDHRDSPYSHISWVCSDSGNYAQLRFFNKVEGGVCLQPSWDDYSAFDSEQNPLTHLIPKQAWPAKDKAGPTWPSDKEHPNPGTLPHTKYVCLFPTAVLLNKSVMSAANGDYRKAKPNIIIVGLGSAIGISVLAHHFPEASITVVDIDQTVIDMVLGHYPFMNWLNQQKCSDGRERLKIVACDARQYLHYADMRNDNGLKYDIVVLDAYTSGSTIPSHLMTKEFFEEIRNTMKDDGILMSNIIGSYNKKKKHVVGGAMRSMHAAGLNYVHNFPIISHPSHYPFEHREAKADIGRNNIIMASPYPLNPSQRKASWKTINNFTMYPELKINKYITELVQLLGPSGSLTSEVSSLSFARDNLNKLRSKANATQKQKLKDKKTFAKNDDIITAVISDKSFAELCKEEVKALWKKKVPLGWNAAIIENTGVYYNRTDRVLFVRRCFQRSVAASQKKDGSLYKHSIEYVTGTDDPLDRKNSLNPQAPLFTDAQPNADIYNR